MNDVFAFFCLFFNLSPIGLFRKYFIIPIKIKYYAMKSFNKLDQIHQGEGGH